VSLAKERIAIHKAYLLSCVNSRLEDLQAAARILRGNRVAAGVTLYLAAASAEIQAQAEADGTWQTLLDAGAVALPASCGPCIGLGQGLLAAGEVGISATNRNFKGRMGDRDARCYLASPEVVAASAIAGVITGPFVGQGDTVRPRYEVLAPPAAVAERVQLLDGFPTKKSGRLVFATQDNINTDGIYAAEHTYREDVPPARMAEVAMQNYDPTFKDRVHAGDILVGGSNFGTGSSREQAVTALQHKGLAMVVAASFSQTYLRNAFNNGFLCVACPSLVAALREELAGKPVEPTWIPGEELTVEFENGLCTWRGKTYRFRPLGSVPQALVVKGGVENVVRAQLGLA
jgi:homoaconitate hydratase